MRNALYNTKQIKALEKLAVEKGIEEYELMERAGKAAYAVLEEKWPQAKNIIVCIGKGNNAGDGLILARLAFEKGLQVTIFSAEALSQIKSVSTQKALLACQKIQIPMQLYNPKETILAADVVIDALLGTGLRGDIRSHYYHFISAINAQENPVLALDLPSGLSADTGCILRCAVQADVTLTFLAEKQGMYTRNGPSTCGEIILNSLDLPPELLSKVIPTAKMLTTTHMQALLPKRDRDSHKGDYGHVLVVGGEYGMGGAVRMAAEAAMRVGAGLVTVATRPEHVPVVSGSRPEIMCFQVAEKSDLDPLLERATVIVVGPGLGKGPWAESLLERVLESSLPKLLDADALNLLSQKPSHRTDWILTPHPGEAARLLKINCQEIQDDRFQAINTLQGQYGGVVVLKGVGTLVKGINPLIHLCKAGNPGMASGGMGDVLSGIIGGLMAQKMDLLEAAELGVYIHAEAGDRAAKEGGERGLLATDLLSQLRYLVNPDAT